MKTPDTRHQTPLNRISSRNPAVYSLLGLTLLIGGNQANAQNFNENFMLGEPFASVQGPGSYSSFGTGTNKFASAVSSGGGGTATNVRGINVDPAGVNFFRTDQAGQFSGLSIDMGDNIRDTSIADTSFVSTQFTIIDMDDPSYNFQFSLINEDGFFLDNLTDFVASIGGGTGSITDIGTNLFNYQTLTQTNPSGQSLSLISSSSSHLRTMDLPSIPAGSGDAVLVFGSRTLNTVPEPSSSLLSVLGITGLLLRRRRA